MTIILRFFPNGEFSQGCDTTKSPKSSTTQTSSKDTAPLDKGTKQCYLDEHSHSAKGGVPYNTQGYQFQNSYGHIYTYLWEESNGTHHLCLEGEKFAYEDVQVTCPIAVWVIQGNLTPLGLSDAPILTAPKPSRKKCLSMTSNMGRNLRNAVYLLEEKYGKEQLSFLTLTLPNLSQDALALCCVNWDKMVNMFTRWLRTRLALKCMELEYAYCTEIQPGRLKNRGEYAPHLHIVFRGKAYRKQAWAVSWLDCRLAWAEIISKFINESFDTRALENIQRIKKSAARYLSKYLSKKQNSIPATETPETPIAQLHTQWGGMARSLSRAVRKAIVRLTGTEPGSIGQRFYDGIHVLLEKKLIRYWSSRFIATGRDPDSPSCRGISVGVGCLSVPTDKNGLVDCLTFLCKDSYAFT